MDEEEMESESDGDLEGGPWGSDSDNDEEEEKEEEEQNPWHEISTTAGAYCIVCRRGIGIGEDAWWNHENRDVACSVDGRDLFEEEQRKKRNKKIMDFLF